MSDEERRKRERKANVEASTTGVAESDLERDNARARRYYDPYSALIGKWVLVQGVRQHYRGLLGGVTYYAGGARLVFEKLYDLANFNQDNPNLDEGEMEIQSPAILLEGGILVIAPQPPKWPTK